MTKGPKNQADETRTNQLWLNRTISIVMLLISFLTFWSIAISSYEQSKQPHFLIRAAITSDLGLERLMSRK